MNEETLFIEALEIRDPFERAQFLERACAGDAAVRGRLEQLLDQHERAGSFLGRPAVAPREVANFATGTASTGTHSPDGSGVRVGTVIGPYKLLQQIGEGGMGTVFMAEQIEPVKRRVALKVIKAGMDSRQVVARFEAERQALAMMDHVNIARVFDGGTTENGRPFFVMELVHGVPITKYCDDNHLTPRERLELFVPVCQAIQHAHQKGIIHRDIKPSNVMVTLYDGKPIPKVIDFGVAKAIEQKLTDRTLFTQFGAVVGSLEYMSPEQAEMSALGVDTRSDIYSLGVLLYELLTGSTPLSHKRMREVAYGEILRIIKEEEPPKPSTRLSDSGEALASISAQRQMEPAKLTKLVRGELDWIVMKCLEKDRSRRYETANAFAVDVQRYLADETVQACPPSTGYRLGKFARRNKGPILAGALVLLALFAAGIGAAFGLSEAQKQREVTSFLQQAQLARAEAEAARDGEAIARREVEVAREKLAAVEYGRTIQLAHQAWRDKNIPATLALLESTRADFRGWEWRYVQRLCHSQILTLKGHTSAVLSASFSRDGTRVATGSEDNMGRVWDATTGESLLVLEGHTGVVRSSSFNPDGSRVVTGSHDLTARIWDAKTGAEVLALKGHTGIVASAAFSPDGSQVVTGSGDRTARIWDAKTGIELRAFAGHSATILSASFSADGSRVLTGSTDQTARIWNAKAGGELRTLRGHTGDIWAASFSPDGMWIVTGSHDRTARLWDATTGTERFALKGHTGIVASAAFSSDGTRVVTGSHDRTARVWDAKTGMEILTLRGHTREIASASFSPDGSRVITGSGELSARVWDATAEQEALILKGHTSFVRSASFSPDGTRIVTGSADNTAKMWDARTGAEQHSVKGHSGVIPTAAFSPDGAWVVSGSSGRTPKSWNPKTGAARIWDAKTGAERLSLSGHTEDIWSASYNPDGSQVVTGSQDGTARLWNARTGASLHVLEGHTGAVRSASFSPDGTRVVTGSHDRTAKLWNASTGAEILTLKGHSGGVTAVSFSPDGTQLVTGSGDNTAKVWDAGTGTELYTLKGHTAGLMSAAFSPDGTRIVTGCEDNTAKVWDARTGAEVLCLLGHMGVVYQASFSADGSRIVTCGDTTARVWDVRKGP